MENAAAFLVYAASFRLAMVGASTLSIYLGYRLFLRGIPPSDSGTTVEAGTAQGKLVLRNAAPGTCFALFGAMVLMVTLFSGMPEFSLQQAPTHDASLLLRSSDPVRITDDVGHLTEKADELVAQSDFSAAMEGYSAAVEVFAEPINHLAWEYRRRGRYQEAYHLAVMATRLQPDNANFLDTLGHILSDLDRDSEAVEVMERAAMLDPRFRSRLINLTRGSP